MGACCSKPSADLDEVNRAQDATGGLADTYEVKHLLGSGSAGDTWLCRDRSSGELLAVKLMKRPIPPLMGTNIMREVKIGAQLGKGHLNIVKPRELILTRTHLGLVMEYVAGGNMADYILKTILLKFGSFDTRDGLVMEEEEARYFFIQIISAVDYCHKNKVAHRDLKMDNTLLDDNDPPRIKLCDFGFAKWWTQEPHMSTITGTPDYMSPQLLGPKASNKAALYDGTKADIWAAGVMLCVMLIGRFPFEGIEMSNATNLEEVSAHVWRQQQQSHWYDNPLIAQDCTMLSEECVDLLNKMFHLEEDKRITTPEIRAHPWFRKPLPPLYAQALGALNQEQAKIDEQVRQVNGGKAPAGDCCGMKVASGAYVSRDRDSALKRMIFLAASRYSPEQEELISSPSSETASGLRVTASMLRKISLTSINPFEYETPAGHTDLATISNFFKQQQQHADSDEPLSPEPSIPEDKTVHQPAHAAAAQKHEQQNQQAQQQQQHQQQPVANGQQVQQHPCTSQVHQQQQGVKHQQQHVGVSSNKTAAAAAGGGAAPSPPSAAVASVGNIVHNTSSSSAESVKLADVHVDVSDGLLHHHHQSQQPVTHMVAAGALQ